MAMSTLEKISEGLKPEGRSFGGDMGGL